MNNYIEEITEYFQRNAVLDINAFENFKKFIQNMPKEEANKEIETLKEEIRMVAEDPYLNTDNELADLREAMADGYRKAIIIINTLIRK